MEGTTQRRRTGLPVSGALAVLRLALGAMFLWVFFENLGKGVCPEAGYKGVIDFFLTKGHARVVEAVMSMAAANASITAPLQSATELGFGVLLLAGVATRVVATAAGAFLFRPLVDLQAGRRLGLGAGHAGDRRLLPRLGAGRADLGRGRAAGAPTGWRLDGRPGCASASSFPLRRGGSMRASSRRFLRPWSPRCWSSTPARPTGPRSPRPWRPGHPRAAPRTRSRLPDRPRGREPSGHGRVPPTGLQRPATGAGPP